MKFRSSIYKYETFHLLSKAEIEVNTAIIGENSSEIIAC